VLFPVSVYDSLNLRAYGEPTGKGFGMDSAKQRNIETFTRMAETYGGY